MISDERGAVLSALDDLVERYRALEVVARGEPGKTRARREQLRAVAARFPTALRELDAIGAAGASERATTVVELRARVRAGAGDEAIEAAPMWLRGLLQLVPRLRTVLGIKAWLARHAPVDGLRSADARRRVRSCYPDADDALLDRIASPPGGQIQQVAYEDAAGALAIDVNELKRTLYGD